MAGAFAVVAIQSVREGGRTEGRQVGLYRVHGEYAGFVLASQVTGGQDEALVLRDGAPVVIVRTSADHKWPTCVKVTEGSFSSGKSVEAEYRPEDGRISTVTFRQPTEGPVLWQRAEDYDFDFRPDYLLGDHGQSYVVIDGEPRECSHQSGGLALSEDGELEPVVWRDGEWCRMSSPGPRPGEATQ